MYIRKYQLVNLIKILPLILMFCFVSGVFSPDMNIKNSLMSLDLEQALHDQSGSSSFKQLFWAAMFIYSSILFFIFNGQFKKSKALYTFIFLMIYCFLSLLWSEEVLLSFKRFILQIMVVMSLLFSLVIVSDEEKIHRVIYSFFLFLLAYNVFFILFFSQYAFDSAGTLTGIYKGKNYLGFVSVIAFIVSYSMYNLLRYEKSIYKRIAIFSTVSWFVILLLSMSKTCISIAFLFYFFWFVKNKQRSKVDVLLIIAILFFVISFYLILPIISFSLQGDLGYYFDLIFGHIDLTGRGEIWALSFSAIEENFYFGNGYGAYWGVGNIPLAFDIRDSYLRFINQSHNGYLDLYLQIGFIGLVIFSLLLYLFVCSNYGKLPFYLKYVFIFSLIHNFTESSLLRDTHFVWFFLLICLVYSFCVMRKGFK